LGIKGTSIAQASYNGTTLKKISFENSDVFFEVSTAFNPNLFAASPCLKAMRLDYGAFRAWVWGLGTLG
jgi:hypothetical protein